MPDFQPRLADATTARERMDALCEFIEFWLGTRQEEYSESMYDVESISLPMPLQRLYSFAGRWPGFDKRLEQPFVVGAFACQDSLRPLSQLKLSDTGRVIFLDENQGCWVCSTLTEGDDPPVWCDGDFYLDDEPQQDEQMVCESLSRFLVTFVLQEILLGSRVCLVDDGLSEQFEADKDQATIVWENGPYVYGSHAVFYLWNGVLVANLWGSYSFGANDEQAIAFLRQREGDVKKIGIHVWMAWRLEITLSGAGKIRYTEWPNEEEATFADGTFDFSALLEELAGSVEQQGDARKNPVLFLDREGQSCTEGKNMHNQQRVTQLFEYALAHVNQPNEKLGRLFGEEWPY
ncbi:hypothetical protein [Bremerella sp.]|uniref:hypothetical protein n=1 Tax=Bremerella sp. TaxID=2795602 RepID=UPI00391A277D